MSEKKKTIYSIGPLPTGVLVRALGSACPALLWGSVAAVCGVCTRVLTENMM